MKDNTNFCLVMPRKRSGQISVEALAPRTNLWELGLNDLNDDFVEVPGVCHEGQPPFFHFGQSAVQDLSSGGDVVAGTVNMNFGR
ncbi:hypothetical protein V6N13_051085 [Hibiscus sabdariffa]